MVEKIIRQELCTGLLDYFLKDYCRAHPVGCNIHVSIQSCFVLALKRNKYELVVSFCHANENGWCAKYSLTWKKVSRRINAQKYEGPYIEYDHRIPRSKGG